MELKAPANSVKKKRIIGRGSSSGRGGTSTRGHKGLKARAGSTIKLGFEGGQMSLIRRMPKYGFTNWPHNVVFKTVNLNDLNAKYGDDEEVTPKSLREKKLASGKYDAVKVLGTGEIKKKLVIGKGVKLTKKAEELIKSAGGSVKA